MVDAGILDGDYVVARVQDVVGNGDIVVAGIPGEEATVKSYRKAGGSIVLEPANAAMEPMRFERGEVEVFGKVVTVLRKL
jgi:repressor LexA